MRRSARLRVDAPILTAASIHNPKKAATAGTIRSTWDHLDVYIVDSASRPLDGTVQRVGPRTSEVVMAAEPDEAEVEAAKAKVLEQIAELDDLDYQIKRRKEREAIQRRKARVATEHERPH